jgi:hypothetical protein
MGSNADPAAIIGCKAKIFQFPPGTKCVPAL